MKLQSLHLVVLAASGALAHGDNPRPEHGFVGYGIEAMQPFCAFACRDSISGATLNCSEIMHHEMDGEMEMMAMTDGECYAKDDAFLQTLAWCVKTRCADVPAWKLEKFWVRNVAGTSKDQPDPKYTYQQALDRINGTPTAVTDGSGSLNKTSIVAEETWFAAYNTDRIFVGQETQHERFGLVVLLSGFIIPIAFSLVRFVPFPGALRSKFNAWVVDPPLIGSKHDAPVFFGLFQMPKRGQALFIFYLIAINIILSAVGYEWANPNTWYPDSRYRWMVMLVSNRTGILSFANLPLVFLYAGRNNVLLWMTNWSHSTFILLHRWIAAIAALQAIIHSIMYLHVYSQDGEHSSESKLPYWYWGAIATIGLSVLLPTSLLPLRKRFYELFLAWHQIIAILIVVGCYYHIILAFGHQWGYETWIWVCMAVWGFDRVARLFRLARNGIKKAEITVIDDDYVRITVPNVEASGHAYVYFPTLTWRVWENHPFSIASTTLGTRATLASSGPASTTSDIEKQPTTVAYPVRSASEHSSQSAAAVAPTSGVTFYVRTRTGLTGLLRGRTTIPVLLESGYSTHSLVAKPLTTSPTLLAIAGGVGITAVLPHARAHPGRVKLFWGCRSSGLVEDVEATGALAHVEKEVFVGKRMGVREILEAELNGSAAGEVCVLVSGPEGMIDEVRNEVGDLVRKGHGLRVRLEVESFSW